MPRITRNRGKESRDDVLFGKKAMPTFRNAVDDYCFLLTRGYGAKSSVALVGNRYRLNVRQQKALRNMGASEEQVALRTARSLRIEDLKNENVSIDGFNLLIILESAFSGAYVFKGRDGFYRDVSGVHGSYKKVSKTETVVQMIGASLNQANVLQTHWILDSPVSNSGRLKAFLQTIAQQNSWNWKISLEHNPDKVLAKTEDIVITSDAWVLDEAKRNYNLAGTLIERHADAMCIVAP